MPNKETLRSAEARNSRENLTFSDVEKRFNHVDSRIKSLKGSYMKDKEGNVVYLSTVESKSWKELLVKRINARDLPKWGPAVERLAIKNMIKMWKGKVDRKLINEMGSFRLIEGGMLISPLLTPKLANKEVNNFNSLCTNIQIYNTRLRADNDAENESKKADELINFA